MLDAETKFFSRGKVFKVKKDKEGERMKMLERRKRRKEKKKQILEHYSQKLEKELNQIHGEITEEDFKKLKKDDCKEDDEDEMEIEKLDIVESLDFENPELLKEFDER